MLQKYSPLRNLAKGKKSLVEIHGILQKTRSEVEAKKSELRELVGDHYRSVLESSDHIRAMSECASMVAQKAEKADELIATMRELAASPPVEDGEGSPAADDSEFLLCERLAELLDLPERVRDLVADFSFVEAARVALVDAPFLQAEVQQLLDASPSPLPGFDIHGLIAQQAAFYRSLPRQVASGCVDAFDEAELTPSGSAEAFVAHLLLDDAAQHDAEPAFFAHWSFRLQALASNDSTLARQSAMQTSDDVEKATVFAAGAVIQMLLCLRLLYFGIGHRRVIVAGILLWLRSWTVKGPVSDVKCSQERVVAERLRQARLRMGRIYLHTITVALVFALVSIQTNIVLDRPRWMPAVTTWTLIGSTGLVALPCVLPGILNASTLDGFLVVLQGSMTVIASPLGSNLPQGVFVSLACLALVRIPAACFATHIALPIACCLAHSGMMMLRGMVELTSANDDGNSKAMAYGAIWGELFSCITMVGAAFLVQAGRGEQISPNPRASLKTTVRRGLQHGDAATELCAATSLLRLTCDAVLELDEAIASHVELDRSKYRDCC
ncbi:Cog1 [Symbiodinium sp. CCMP2592]|nr:Cog1 [Symbiodinium sp. CCMP2592]